MRVQDFIGEIAKCLHGVSRLSSYRCYPRQARDFFSRSDAPYGIRRTVRKAMDLAMEVWAK